MKEYVPIFFDWVEVTGELNAQEKGRLIDAIVLYAQGGDWQEQIKGNERYLFPAFRKQIDRANEISDIRADAGSKRKQNGTNYSKPKQNGTNRANANEEEYNKEYKEYIEDDKERARDGISYQHTQIGTLISTCLKAMTPRAWEELKVYMGEMPEDLIAWAVQTSCEHGGNNWSYVSAVLRGLQSAGIKTVEDAEKRSEEHRKKRNQRQQQTGKPSNIAQLNYSQREYPEQKPGELPDWYVKMLEDEQKAEAAKKAGVQPEMPEWLAEMMMEEASGDDA